MTVAILLSTFNGELFLREQLNSIFEQSYTEFTLYIRDDGSSDKTIEIVHEYINLYPSKCVLIDAAGTNLGVAKSFRKLVSEVCADIYFFADQDDIWLKDKLKSQISCYTNFARENEPTLVFSNMVVFQEGSGETYNYFQRFNLNQKVADSCVLQGVVSGCVMLFNAALKKVYLEKTTTDVEIHDYNMFIAASLYGKVIALDEQLIQHRMHANNCVGDRANTRIVIQLKDFVKFIFANKLYRTIVLKTYFSYAEELAKTVEPAILLKHEVFQSWQVDKMSYFKRKYWYNRHFGVVLSGLDRVIKTVLI